MPKVFIFCVGGTGLRVMKSITMLAASGMKAGNFTLVPIIVDPHAELTENSELYKNISNYNNIFRQATQNKSSADNAPKGFFHTEISLDGLDAGKTSNDKRPFAQYLDTGKLSSDDVNQYLIQTLFSSENLANSLAVGFKGSPNVGTVVLSRMIEESGWYQYFRENFTEDDRIFIISSIFGGTGASGYPLLEKMIRSNGAYPKIQQALVGSVTLLPYYALSDAVIAKSDIDSSSFYTKAKAALSYYEKTAQSDYLYYIGEQEVTANYKNNESEQKDTAHFIELMAATALFDFLQRPKPEKRPQCMSRAIKNAQTSIDLTMLGGQEDETLVKCFADMTLFGSLTRQMEEERHFPLAKTIGLNASFYNNRDYLLLKEFVKSFEQWRIELAKNSRSFSPLNDYNLKDLGQLVRGVSLEGKNENWYLLEIIRASKKYGDKKGGYNHGNKLRYFLDFSYEGIDKYTSGIIQSKSK